MSLYLFRWVLGTLNPTNKLPPPNLTTQVVFRFISNDKKIWEYYITSSLHNHTHTHRDRQRPFRRARVLNMWRHSTHILILFEQKATVVPAPSTNTTHSEWVIYLSKNQNRYIILRLHVLMNKHQHFYSSKAIIIRKSLLAFSYSLMQYLICILLCARLRKFSFNNTFSVIYVYSMKIYFDFSTTPTKCIFHCNIL